MLTILSRIVHYGVQNFRRNGWPSTATVAIMTLSLLMFQGLILFNVITGAAVESIQDKIDISIYFKTDTSEDDILSVKQSLESLGEVKAVEYVSRDRALEIFKDNHKDDVTITQAVNELNENPLVASLNIKARRPDQYATIAEYMNAPNLTRFVEHLNYSKNQAVIDRLTAIIDNVNRGGFVLTVVLAFVAGLVVFNTIRLAIYSSRDEIGIMRAVGASNSLVRGPFVVEGMIAAVLAAVIGMMAALPVIYAASPYLEVFIPGLNLFQYFYTHSLSLFIYQLLFGAAIGSLSSFVAVRRYLRN